MPGSFWSGRRSTIATSMPASASSAANISPVGPAPEITTACSLDTRILVAPSLWLGAAGLRQQPGLEARPLCTTYLSGETRNACFPGHLATFGAGFGSPRQAAEVDDS